MYLDLCGSTCGAMLALHEVEAVSRANMVLTSRTR